MPRQKSFITETQSREVTGCCQTLRVKNGGGGGSTDEGPILNTSPGNLEDEWNLNEEIRRTGKALVAKRIQRLGLRKPWPCLEDNELTEVSVKCYTLREDVCMFYRGYRPDVGENGNQQLLCTYCVPAVLYLMCASS